LSGHVYFWGFDCSLSEISDLFYLFTGYGQEGGSRSKVMICSIGGSNWDWQFLHALQGMHRLFWMAGILWPLRHMQWQQSAERWTESMSCGMMSLFDFANHVLSIAGCTQKEK
jgi:hypothetical protein